MMIFITGNTIVDALHPRSRKKMKEFKIEPKGIRLMMNKRPDWDNPFGDETSGKKIVKILKGHFK